MRFYAHYDFLFISDNPKSNPTQKSYKFWKSRNNVTIPGQQSRSISTSSTNSKPIITVPETVQNKTKICTAFLCKSRDENVVNFCTECNYIKATTKSGKLLHINNMHKR